MRVLILWWREKGREGEKRREGEGSERQSGMDGKSRDLLAGIKRVPACLKHEPSALIRDEDISVLMRKSCIRVFV